MINNINPTTSARKYINKEKKNKSKLLMAITAEANIILLIIWLDGQTRTFTTLNR